MFKVVHIAWSHLVGHPYSIVKALNKYTDFSARFVNLYQFQYGIYDTDLMYPDDLEEIIQVIHEADIIHIHQTIELENNILGINFKKLQKEGKKLVRQWSSEPGHYRYYGMPDVEDFFDEEGVQHLVTGQYHERFYGNALPVPLILDSQKFDSVDISTDWTKPSLCYSPSNRFTPMEKRWATKGYYEFLTMIEELKKEYVFDFKLVEEKSHREVLETKGISTLVADEMVTGTYHTSALEGLALGKPTFAYLDQRTSMTLALLTQTNEFPFISVNLKQFPTLFKELVNNPELCRSIGEYSKEWYQKYYHERHLIKFHADIYKKLLSGNLKPQKLLLENSLGKEFLKIKKFDLVFKYNNEIGD